MDSDLHSETKNSWFKSGHYEQRVALCSCCLANVEVSVERVGKVERSYKQPPPSPAVLWKVNVSEGKTRHVTTQKSNHTYEMLGKSYKM